MGVPSEEGRKEGRNEWNHQSINATSTATKKNDLAVVRRSEAASSEANFKGPQRRKKAGNVG
jgi:hypothetical protein